MSSSFLLPCRKHLFSKLSLNGHGVCQGLHQFLVENPVLQSFVRSITIKQGSGYDVQVYDLLNCTSLIAVLRLPFCRLENFSINNFNRRGFTPLPVNWNNFSSELKDTLSTIIHSSTLKTLYLNKVNVPIMLFRGINLTQLKLHNLSPNEFVGEQSRLLAQAASEGMATTVSPIVIDHCKLAYYFRPVHSTRFPVSAYLSLI